MTPWSAPIGKCAAALLCIATLAAGAQTRTVPAEAPTHVAADTTPVWRFTTPSDITFFLLARSDPPRLVVATKDALFFIDAATGKALWSRDDLPKAPAVHFDLMDAESPDSMPLGRGIALKDTVMQIFDLETGAKLSESGDWSVTKVSGYLPVYRHDLVLVLAKTAAGTSALLGVELQSGTVRWRREDLFKEAPKMYQARIGTGLMGAVYTATLVGNQPPVQLDSANLLLYLSKDGPFGINAATGETVWSGAVLKGEDVPGTAEGYAHIRVEQGVAYVPSVNTLVALKTSDGTPVWPSAPQLPGRIVQMRWTARGLLVGGAKPDGNGYLTKSPFLDLLDPATGRSLWPAPVTDLKDRSAFTVRGDTAYLIVKKQLVAIDLASGSARDIATFKFEGREQPYRVEMTPDGGALLISDHNLLLLGAGGSPKYQRYYPAPGVDFFTAFGNALLSKPISRGATGLARDFAYIFTTAPDSSGHEGLSLVRVNKADGAEAGRIWLTEKSFDYETDPTTDIVYLKQGKDEIVARRFEVAAPAQPEVPKQ